MVGSEIQGFELVFGGCIDLVGSGFDKDIFANDEEVGEMDSCCLDHLTQDFVGFLAFRIHDLNGSFQVKGGGRHWTWWWDGWWGQGSTLVPRGSRLVNMIMVDRFPSIAFCD